MDLPDRRRDQRARITVPVRLIARGSEGVVEMVDASYRGLFLRLEEAPPIRQLIKLAIELPTGTIVVHAVVVRIVEDELGRPGVGLRFFAMSGELRAQWEQFITNVLHGRGSRAA